MIQTTTALKNILDRITDSIVALDLNWCYTYVNNKAGEILNRDPGQLIGKHIWTEFPEGVGKPFHLAYEKAIKHQTYIYIEEYYQPYDLWFENHIYPSPDGLSIVFRDITGRKKLEEKLANNEQLFRTISNHAPVAIFQTDPNGECTFVNKQWLNYSGMQFDEAMGAGWSSAIHPEDLDRIWAEWNEASQKGFEFSSELRFLHKNGKVTWLSAKAVKLEDVNHGFKGHVGMASDITDHKMQNEALIRSNQRNAAFLQAMPDIIFIIDKQGLFIDYNNPLGFQTLTPPETFLSKTVFEILPPDIAGEIMHNLQMVFEKGASPTQQYQLPFPEGIQHFEARYAKINDNEVLVIVRDISSQKEAEEKIRQLNEKLERRVKDRTAELEIANENLQEINDLFIGNEITILELKEEMMKLKDLLDGQQNID